MLVFCMHQTLFALPRYPYWADHDLHVETIIRESYAKDASVSRKLGLTITG